MFLKSMIFYDLGIDEFFNGIKLKDNEACLIVGMCVCYVQN